jgi:hypothetical protein
MALTVKHNHQTAIADDPTKDVSATEWNEDHAVTGVLDVANGGTGTTTDTKVDRGGDTMSGALTANAGVIVPTRGTESTGYCANTAYVENRANAWAYAAAGDRLARTGDTSSGKQYFEGGVYTTIGYGGSGGSIEIKGPGGGAMAAISLHRPGAFACNFGLDGDNAIAYGGWSFGGSVYLIWSSQYCSNPNNHAINNRLTYYGDYGYGNNTGLQEPWDTTVATGMNNDVYQSGNIYLRHRQLQVQVAWGGWYACYYA